MRKCPTCGRASPDDSEFCPFDATPLDPPQPVVREVPRAIGPYEIERKLGEGGAGAVYLGRHTRLGRRAAIKVLSAALAGDPDILKRFEREARTAAQIRHPNVCAVYDFGETPDGQAFIAMEYIEGETLDNLLARSAGSLEPERAARIAHEVALALHAAHQVGIVHRDLKPGNIMIGQADGTEAVTVVDFGIAKAVQAVESDQVTRMGLVIGTPAFMSPEQLFGDKIGPASDTYSLGLVAFQMLAGAVPFQGDNASETMAARLTRDPDRLCDVRPDLDLPATQAVLDRALARRPADRWENARDFGDALVDAVRTDLAPRSSHDDRTRILTRTDWVPPPPDFGPIDEASDATQLFAVSGARGADVAFPVAVTITAARDPRRIGTRVRCERFPFIVGRSVDAHLHIPDDEALSRQHLAIEHDEHGFHVRDLSTNGVYVNGRHIAGTSAPLDFGTTIFITKSTALAFVADVPLLPDLAGQRIGGRLQLERRLHGGVKAATYLGHDTRLPHRPLVIKIFSPSLLQLGRYREEFEREARMAAALKHPHICKVLEFGNAAATVEGKAERLAFLSMEFMEGGNLNDQLAARPAPDLAVVTPWIETMAGALAHAHRNGIVHGNLKPACIVFDRDGVPYLTDFALATSAASELGAAVVGTPAYLAPELWQGQPASPATDQFSLAALSYQMVTGVRPFEGQADPEVRQRNFGRGAAPAHEEAGRAGRAGVPPSVSMVLARGMSVDPGDRYDSVLAFSHELARAVADPGGAGSKPRVFLSYQRQSSAAWAILFARSLEEHHGCSVFVDAQNRDGAPEIPKRLRDAIVASDVFVCLLAPGTLSSAWVRQELDIAREHGKPMVPVFHEDYRPKEEPQAEIPAVRALLEFDAVHLMDRRNVYIDHAIAELGTRIRGLAAR